MEPSSHKSPMKVLLRTKRAAQVIEIIAVLGVPFIFFFTLTMITEDHIIAILAALLSNLLAIIFIFVSLRLRGETVSDLGLHIHRRSLRYYVKTVLLSFPVFIVATIAFVSGTSVAQLFVIQDNLNLDSLRVMNGDVLFFVLTLISTFIFASFGEEFIYRGFLITRINEMGGNTVRTKVVSVLFSAILFGLVHFQWGLIGVIQTTLMGLVLALAFQTLHRNLLITILAHAYMDAILVYSTYVG